MTARLMGCGPSILREKMVAAPAQDGRPARLPAPLPCVIPTGRRLGTEQARPAIGGIGEARHRSCSTPGRRL